MWPMPCPVEQLLPWLAPTSARPGTTASSWRQCAASVTFQLLTAFAMPVRPLPVSACAGAVEGQGQGGQGGQQSDLPQGLGNGRGWSGTRCVGRFGGGRAGVSGFVRCLLKSAYLVWLECARG